jgi:hypothetical protein
MTRARYDAEHGVSLDEGPEQGTRRESSSSVRIASHDVPPKGMVGSTLEDGRRGGVDRGHGDQRHSMKKGQAETGMKVARTDRILGNFDTPYDAG